MAITEFQGVLNQVAKGATHPEETFANPVRKNRNSSCKYLRCDLVINRDVRFLECVYILTFSFDMLVKMSTYGKLIYFPTSTVLAAYSSASLFDVV